jgi:hypothetical protein
LLLSSFSRTSVFGLIVSFVSKVQEGGKMRINFNDHVTAVTTIPSVRASFGYIFLPSETDASPAAVTPLDRDFRVIDKQHITVPK